LRFDEAILKCRLVWFVFWWTLMLYGAYTLQYRSSLKTGTARPGPARARKIALDITAVDIDLFFSLQYWYNDHI